MYEIIGEVAGRIWSLLNKNGKVSLSQLPKSLKEADAITYQALGWLAREGKVEYHKEKNKTSVSLKNIK